MFFEREKLSKLNILGLSIGLIGLVIIALVERDLFSGPNTMILGVVFSILAGIVFAIYTVLSKIYVNEIGTFKLKSFAFISGSVILFVISSIFKIDMAFELTKSNIFSLAYLGIVITGIGFFFYFEGLKNISTYKGAMFFYLKPVIAGVLAYIFLKETLTIIQIMGFGIVFLGVNLERIYSSLQNKVGN